MKKVISIIALLMTTIFCFASDFRIISSEPEEDYYVIDDGKKVYFFLGWKKVYTTIPSEYVSYDSDGYLKLTYNNRQLLVIEGEKVSHECGNFRTDGINQYDEFSTKAKEDGSYSRYHDYNVKKISTTSYLKEKQYGKEIIYLPDNLFRNFLIGCRCHPYWWNDSHIPWVEGVKGNGIGESVTIEFTKEVYGISVLNGYTDINNMKLFKENSRVKQLIISDLKNNIEKIVDFDDKVYFNYIEFDKPTDKIRLTIKDVYPGTKYQDTCISSVIENTNKPERDVEIKKYREETFENLLNNCKEVSPDSEYFKDYFNNFGQEVGLSAVVQKTERYFQNIFNQDYYYLDDTLRLSFSSEDNVHYEFGVGSKNSKKQYKNGEAYYDVYGYKQLKIYNDDGTIAHHYTIIDTAYQIVSNYEFEPNTWRYAFFEHDTEFLKDDLEAIKKYFKVPDSTMDNGKKVQKITASSSLNEGTKIYSPENILAVYATSTYNDHNQKWSNKITPWVEGKKGDGIGEYIEFDIPAEIPYADIRILNGYVNPLKPHLYKENNRIKKALIETDTEGKKEITFEDVPEFTQIALPYRTKHFKLTILDVYPGTKYQDTCITAIEIGVVQSEK